MSANRRFWELMGGLFLVVIGLAALSSGEAEMFPVLLALVGFYLLARQFDRTQQNSQRVHSSRRRGDRSFSEQPARSSSDAEQVYSHAIDAARRAGIEPDTAAVLPVDIGVIAERADHDPVVYRAQPVPDDVDYIRPFVQLRLPTRATGRIRFELIDSNDAVVYIHEDIQQFERGRHLVTPSSRLPVHDELATDGRWQLKVFADNMLMATHIVGWRESSEAPVRLDSDGELSNELRAAIIDSQSGSMSLDELLAHQDESARQQRTGRR